MIQVKNLSTRYARNAPEVLHDVSFGLGEGEIGILLGPNGSGKSTLIQCLLGQMKRAEGEILIGGKPVMEMRTSDRARLLAYVPQTPSFAPSTVYDAVMLGRLPYFAFAPTKEDQDIVETVLAEMSLEHLATRNVLELSGGERQRVAIARALAQQSRILLFDEPTSNLDISAETTIAEMVKALAKKKGLTVLLSMHDINLALGIGDRFLFLKDGRLVSDGDADSVNEKTIESVFGIHAKRVYVEDKTLFIYGGNGDES